MPVVQVRYNQDCLSQKDANWLAVQLTQIVAEALSLPDSLETRIAPATVYVWMTPKVLRMLSEKDLEILVLAHNYPARLVCQDELIRRISAQLLVKLNERRLAPLQCGLWLALMPIGYFEF